MRLVKTYGDQVDLLGQVHDLLLAAVLAKSDRGANLVCDADGRLRVLECARADLVVVRQARELAVRPLFALNDGLEAVARRELDTAWQGWEVVEPVPYGRLGRLLKLDRRGLSGRAVYGEEPLVGRRRLGLGGVQVLDRESLIEEPLKGSNNKTGGWRCEGELVKYERCDGQVGCRDDNPNRLQVR